MHSKEVQEKAARVWQMADRINAMIHERLTEAARDAGLDPRVAIIQAHNAMVSKSYGQPWPEVDYDKIGRVAYLSDRLPRAREIASRIVSRLHSRVCPEPPGHPRLRWGDGGSACEWADL